MARTRSLEIFGGGEQQRCYRDPRLGSQSTVCILGEPSFFTESYLMALDDREALSNFISSMKDAEEAARAMAYTTEQPAWLKVVENVAAIRSLATKMAVKKSSLILSPFS